MNDTKDPASPTGNIPVLFDIVERGKFAPTENMIKPPPEGVGDNIDTDSEDITLVPEPPPQSNPEVTKLSLDELEDATEELPIISDDMLEAGGIEFAPHPSEAITDENPVIPKTMLELSESQNEMVDQVMQKLIPRLEALVQETVHEIIKSSQDTETPDENK